MYILKYLPRDGRIYLIDKDLNVVSYALSLAVVEYQTLVLRGDMESASDLLPTVPEDQKNRIARFLEGQGHKEMALDVATDAEHRFDLALGLGRMDVALDIARQANADHKWKTLGDAALGAWDFALAEECFVSARDFGSLLLLYTSTADAASLRRLADKAGAAGVNNVAFSSLWQLGDVDACIDILVRTNRTAEAAIFAQTYRPSRAAEVALKWKEGLQKEGKGKVARTLAVPPGGAAGAAAAAESADEELFPEWDQYLDLERQHGPAPLVEI
jgi:coatomer subunit beta'